MKILVKVSIYEFCDAGADYAFVELTPEYAQKLLKRKATFEAVQAEEGSVFGLYEMHYWNESCLWLGGMALEEEDVPEGADLWEFLEEHLSAKQQKDVDGGDAAVLPDDLEVPEYFAQRTECGQTVVTKDGIYFTSYPRHVDFEQHTMTIPWELVERAAGVTQSAAA